MQLGEMLLADVIMCALAFVIAGFSLAAGVGGGGLYVPLLMAVLSFDTRVATALSQSMLFGGALAALVYNVQVSHPNRPERPLINFELALLMAPALMGGAQVGAVVHAVAPPVLTTVLLLIVLGDAAYKGINNAVKMAAKEDKQEAPNDTGASQGSVVDDKKDIILDRSRCAQIRLLVIWIIGIAVILTKGLLFEICSPAWWILTFGAAIILIGLSWMYAKVLSDQEHVDLDDIDFREKAFPLCRMSVIAGILAAMCGIGGGMVMGPILVESKIAPPVASATTATTLVVLSTSTLLIYVCRGVAPFEYALCLSLFSLVGAAAGKVLVGWWVQKTGKQSIIVWTLAGVTVLSMVLMGFEGFLTFARNPSTALAVKNLCEGHIHHTVPAVD